MFWIANILPFKNGSITYAKYHEATSLMLSLLSYVPSRSACLVGVMPKDVVFEGGHGYFYKGNTMIETQ